MNIDMHPGDYIELTAMPDDPLPIPASSRGYITRLNEVRGIEPELFTQVSVEWDDGRTLMLCVPPDEARVVRRAGELSDAQEYALADLCRRYHVNYDAADYTVDFSLPPGYVAGWVGGKAGHEGPNGPTIYVGVSADGEVSS